VQFTKQELGQYCTAAALDDLLNEIRLFHVDALHVIRRKNEVYDEIEILRSQGFSPLLAMSTGDDELIQHSYAKERI
jgi:hypothetical protein